MSFPQDPLPITGELLINGTWTDVTSKIREDADINIERSFRNEQGNTITVDQCSFTLNNRDGLFTNRYPLSPYYKKLPVGTQFRCSVDDVNGNSLALYNEYYPSGGYVQTADKASLDVVGDMEIRCNIYPRAWTNGVSRFQYLASKWTVGAQQSWYALLDANGFVEFGWSSTGANTLSATSTAAVATSGSKILRVTLDVDNGAAGHTVTFYTASTIFGSYTQLGAAVTVAGVTSVFASTAPLTVGSGPDGSSFFTDTDPFEGNFYRFLLYTGIGGTIVANADFGAQAVDATSWSDGLAAPNTWALSTTQASIVSGSRRFWGEVSEFPNQWDTSGTDIFVPVQASSVMRRISQGDSPPESAMHAYLMDKSTLQGYWAMEGSDGVNADATPSEVDTGLEALATGITFGADSTLASSTSVATLDEDTSYIQGFVTTSTATSYASFTMMFKYAPGLPTAATSDLAFIYGTGTAKFWTFDIDNANFYIRAFDADSAGLGAGPLIVSHSGTALSDWIAIRIQISLSGGNTLVEFDWNAVGATTTNHASATQGASSNLGWFYRFDVNPYGDGSSPDNAGLKVAQVAILQENLRTDDAGFVAATAANAGETAAARFLRVCALKNITAYLKGNPSDSVLMGAQPAADVPVVLQECADTDGGFIYGAREFNGLVMRTQRSLLAQTALQLDYSLNHFDGVLTPTDDDKVMRNDVTVTMPGGGFGRSIITQGPNNINDPTTDPQGVGLYNTAYSLNPSTRRLARKLAGFATYLGTWDELRVPQFQVSLERSVFTANATLSQGIARLDVGDAVKIINWPAWLPPDPIEVLYRGVTEVLANRGWKFTVNAQAYGPFRNVNDLTQSTNTHYRAAANESKTGTSASTLNASVTSVATSFVVNTVAGSQTWIQSAAKPSLFPLLITIAGETMSVGAIGAVSGTSPQQQTFSSVTRSLNGMGKAHSSGEAVQITESFRAAL